MPKKTKKLISKTKKLTLKKKLLALEEVWSYRIEEISQLASGCKDVDPEVAAAYIHILAKCKEELVKVLKE